MSIGVAIVVVGAVVTAVCVYRHLTSNRRVERWLARRFPVSSNPKTLDYRITSDVVTLMHFQDEALYSVAVDKDFHDSVRECPGRCCASVTTRSVESIAWLGGVGIDASG